MEEQEKLEKLKYAFEFQMPVNKFFELRVLKLVDGFSQIHIPFKKDFIGDFIQNRWHGGIQASIVDAAGGLAAMTKMTDLSEKMSTIDMRIDYLHGSEPKDLFAEAKIIKSGARIIIVDVELYHKKSKIIALGRCSFSILKNK